MKKINKKKIALLFAGGSTVNKKKDINNWVLENKEISLIAEILPVFISSKYGGTDMLREINKVIDKNYDQVNGFVLLVDTDLIKKIGLSLTNSLKTISKPVVITSLNIENSKDDNVKVERNFHSGFELKSNLINSVKLSTMKVPAVLILFGDRILKPSKAIMKKSKDFNIFDSIDKKYSGVIDYKLILNEKFETRKEVPTIKFTLRYTPRAERYLRWKTHNTKISKADLLRDLIDNEIKSNEKYQKHLRRQRRGEK